MSSRKLYDRKRYVRNTIIKNLKLEGKDESKFSDEFNDDLKNITYSEAYQLDINQLTANYSKKYGQKVISLKKIQEEKKQIKKKAVEKRKKTLKKKKEIIIENPLDVFTITPITKAFDSKLIDYKIDGEAYNQDIDSYLNRVEQLIKEIRNEELLKKRRISSNITFYINLQDSEGKNFTIPFKLRYRSFDNPNLTGLTDEEIQKLDSAIDKLTVESSGSLFLGLKDIEIGINKYRSLFGRSYVELPELIKNKHAIINIKNKDNKCFMWSVLAALHPVEKDACRVSKYLQYENELKFGDLQFPINIDEVYKFEKLNNIPIHVWILDDEFKPYCGRQSSIKNRKQDEYINLLLHDNHYSFIKNMDRLVSKIIKGDNSNNKTKQHLCYRCQNYKSSHEEDLVYHTLFCQDNNEDHVEEVMPTDKKDKVFFKDGQKSLACPYRIYCDFESSIIKQEDGTDLHLVNSYCVYLVNTYDKIKNVMSTQFATDNNLVYDLVKKLISIQNLLIDKIQTKVSQDLTPSKKCDNKECILCGKYNCGDKEILVNPFSSKTEGLCHSNCVYYYKNYLYKHHKIPVVFHNLRGYDGHFIIKEIGKIANEIDDIMVIPTTKEKYLSFGFERLIFIDSFAFLARSLNDLVSSLSLSKKENTFDHLKRLPNHELFMRKGVYPYEWFDDLSKFNYPSLPNIDNFYSKLNDESISQEDYLYAKQVWNQCECKTFKDYHKLYLEADVLLLACVFENFCNLGLEYYHLDPSQYFSVAGYAWDCMLKMTKVKIGLIKDNDILHIFESGKLGGMSFISNRYAKVENTKTEAIKYLDVNNLYGKVMMMRLPISDYKFINKNDWDTTKILNINEEDEIQYRFVVDLEYPKELHDYHNDFCLAPERRQLREDELSPYQLSILHQREINHFKSEKLMNTLNNKYYYSVEGNELKNYIKKGMKLLKIHKVISYKTSKFLEPYILFNTEKREQAKKINDDFGKDFFKLMNNIIYGKTIENIRDRINFKLANKEKHVDRYLNKPELKNRTIFGENLVGFELIKRKIVMNKPVGVGITILAYSKTLMYNIWYDKLKSSFDNIKLLMTDTDSLCFYVKDDHIDDKLKSLDILDKNTIGKCKDEYPDDHITEFVGLRSKMYSIKTNSGHFKKVAKGIKKNIIKRDITHQMFKDALEINHKPNNIEFHIIVSDLHEVKTKKIIKQSVNGYDDKGYLLDAKTRLSYGHYRIEEKLR